MNISSLPHLTPLAKDYLTRFDSSPIREFFSISPNATGEQILAKIDERLLRERSLPPEASATMHRKSVVAAIRKTIERTGNDSEAIKRNLELLESPETLAIVTGQQAGILGGPIYTFYKALTAIELAKSLSKQFENIAFVPIFWIESEDHDIDEVTKIHVLGEAGLSEIKYTPSSLPNDSSPSENEKWRKQVGPSLLEEFPLNEFFDKLRASLAPTGFSDEVFKMLREIYSPGRTFSEAIASILLQYFGEDGLLIIDANSVEMKFLAKDLFRKEIETSPQLSEKIILQSVKLEENYHAQVKPRALNLFYVNDDGNRLPLIEREPGTASKESGTERSFLLKGTRKTFSMTELHTELETHTERFSTNVVMRPLYQDTLLPTVAYVGGPGETAYFAQFQTAYEWAGLPMPLIYPRLSATLIEERLERIFTKFKITPEEILSGGNSQSTSLFDEMIDSGLSAKFEAEISNIDRSLESLREAVSSADQTLGAALTALKGKVLTTIRDFQNKTLAAERKRHATEKSQLDKLLSAIIPSGELQERELNLVYFLNKYGPNFTHSLKQLLAPIALDFHEHHIVHLDALAEKQNITNGVEELPMPHSG